MSTSYDIIRPYYLVRLSPRRFIIVRDTGGYNVIEMHKVNPEEARHGDIVFGPAEYELTMEEFLKLVGTEDDAPTHIRKI